MSLVQYDDYLKINCTGCSCCFNSCPNKSIVFELNGEGFYYPKITDGCIDCNVCVSKCPQLVDFDECDHLYHNFCYEVYGQDEVRCKSSSGGVFYEISKHFLQKKWIIVGAAFDDNFNVVHTFVDDINEINKLQMSKYVQSDLSNIFTKIKELLIEGRGVVFSGTPCQVDGLKHYLENDYENLFLIDLICQGVPSPVSWSSYIHSNHDNIKTISMRNKKQSIIASMNVEYNDDKSDYHKDINSDPYLRGFRNKLFLRKSCHICKYSSMNRPGDITIGDFWGIIHKYDLGCSKVFINTEAGLRVFNEISSCLLEIIKRPASDGIVGNLISPYLPHPNRERFFHELNKYGFNKACANSIDDTYDVGLVSLINTNNGNNLTYYALYKTLNDMGFSVLMIQCPGTLHSIFPLLNRGEADLGFVPSFSINADKLSNISEKCHTLVVGSDGLFHPIFKNTGYYPLMPWSNSSTNKIAYGPSFWDPNLIIDEKTRDEMKVLLKRFDAIAVREDFSSNILRDQFNINSKLVLDPIFLLGSDDYRKIANYAIIPNSSFVGAYILDITDEKLDFVEEIKQYFNCDTELIIHDNKPQHIKCKNEVNSMNVGNLIALIDKCDVFLTDSFHGACLALIFNKKFYLVPSNTRFGPDRIYSVFNQIGVDKELFYYSESKANEIIDYEQINRKINKIISADKKWLMNKIMTATKKKTNFDIIYDDLLNEKELNKQILTSNSQTTMSIVAIEKFIQLCKDFQIDYAKSDIFDKFASKCVDLINNPNCYMKGLDCLKLLSEIDENYEILYIKHIPKTKQNSDIIINKCNKWISRDNIDAFIILGIEYRKGNIISKDLYKSIDYLRVASDKNSVWAMNELFDTLWELNDPVRDKELSYIGHKAVLFNNGRAFGHLGRLYWNGRGVQKNLYIASLWMKKSADSGTAWAKWEYFKILWEINDPEFDKKMITFAQAECDAGNLELTARLARAYRHGRGVSKNLSIAAKLMKQSFSGPIWAKKEYCEILWDISSSETDLELFSFLSKEVISNSDSFYKELLSKLINSGRINNHNQE